MNNKEIGVGVNWVKLGCLKSLKRGPYWMGNHCSESHHAKTSIPCPSMWVPASPSLSCGVPAYTSDNQLLTGHSSLQRHWQEPLSRFWLYNSNLLLRWISSAHPLRTIYHLGALCGQLRMQQGGPPHHWSLWYAEHNYHTQHAQTIWLLWPCSAILRSSIIRLCHKWTFCQT